MRASVIIPSFNAARTLASTIESVLPQLRENDEVIIVDDGSTDNTYDAVKSFLNNQVILIQQNNSGGPSAPRNAGIRRASGKYIFLFDSDDLMLPGKVEASVNALERNSDAGLVFTNFRTIDEFDNIIQTNFLKQYDLISNLTQRKNEKEFRIETPSAYLQLAKENFIGTSGVAIPSKILKEIGGFDESLKNGDDRDMWFRITRHYPIVYLNNELHCYRVHSGSISQRSVEARAYSKIKVLNKQLKSSNNKDFNNDIKKLISKNYHDIAVLAMNQKKTTNALSNVLKSLKYQKSLNNIGLLSKICMGDNFLRAARKIKNKLK